MFETNCNHFPKSRSFFMKLFFKKSVPFHSKMSLSELSILLGPQEAGVICNIMNTADYRSQLHGHEKVSLIRELCHRVSVALACKLVAIFTKTYYTQRTDEKFNKYEMEKRDTEAPHLLLSKKRKI